MPKKLLLWITILFTTGKALAHPMPGSVVALSVLQASIRGTAQIPLLELSNAVGKSRTTNLVDPLFKTYFTQHIQAISKDHKWTTTVDSIGTITDTDPMVGRYQEAIVYFTLTPPHTSQLRSFMFHYDAVLHQVVTHSALVYVQQDWAAGILGESDGQQVGMIAMDVRSGKIFPLQVNLQKGSWAKGFGSMLLLGMQHIKEGTDHLLFLIVLLLPAMLTVAHNRWAHFRGIRYTTSRLVQIVTAFTIGHSLTLIAGAVGWLRLPSQPVEVLIAVSILVSAIHAIRPLFPGREALVAAGFGLVHGSAFATVLSNVQLNTGTLALSILGFNIGIEIMQLLIILLVVPWLIVLSKTKAYKWVRNAGALLAGIAALGWMLERITTKPNIITEATESAVAYAPWAIGLLCATSVVAYVMHQKEQQRKQQPTEEALAAE